MDANGTMVARTDSRCRRPTAWAERSVETGRAGTGGFEDSGSGHPSTETIRHAARRLVVADVGSGPAAPPSTAGPDGQRTTDWASAPAGGAIR
jgi:hypothetical protein